MIKVRNRILAGVMLSIYTFLVIVAVLWVEIKTHYVERYFVKEEISNEIESEVPLYQQCLENGWKNCLLKMDLNADMCFFGNSITRNSDFGRYYGNMSIVNLGVGGDNLDDLLRRVPMVVAVHPKAVFVMGGGKWSIGHDVRFLSSEVFSIG